MNYVIINILYLSCYIVCYSYSKTNPLFDFTLPVGVKRIVPTICVATAPEVAFVKVKVTRRAGQVRQVNLSHHWIEKNSLQINRYTYKDK